MVPVKMFCAKGDKNFECKEFGLFYKIIKSRYIYGTMEDIERFEKLVSQIGFVSAINKIVPTKEDTERAKKDAIVEMKRIASLYDLDIKEVDYSMITKRWFDHSDYFVGVRYFEKYIEGRILHYKLDELGV